MHIELTAEGEVPVTITRYGEHSLKLELIKPENRITTVSEVRKLTVSIVSGNGCAKNPPRLGYDMLNALNAPIIDVEDVHRNRTAPKNCRESFQSKKIRVAPRCYPND